MGWHASGWIAEKDDAEFIFARAAQGDVGKIKLAVAHIGDVEERTRRKIAVGLSRAKVGSIARAGRAVAIGNRDVVAGYIDFGRCPPALDGEGVGILVAVIVGNRNRRCAHTGGGWVKGDLEGRRTGSGDTGSGCAGDGEVTGIGPANGWGADTQGCIARVLNRKGAHDGAAADSNAAEVGMSSGAGCSVATDNRYIVAQHVDFGSGGQRQYNIINHGITVTRGARLGESDNNIAFRWREVQ